MKVPGYCSECHRIRQVRVTSSGMVGLVTSGVAHGVCDECQDKIDERTRFWTNSTKTTPLSRAELQRGSEQRRKA